MTTDLSIITERIDDFPLLLGAMQRIGLPAILDRHLPRHGHHRGLSWGWIATIWLAHILSQSDHRKQPVQAWVRQAGETIRRITGQELGELDFTDDRLTVLLARMSRAESWQAIETDLGRSLMQVYDLKPERVRLDATTVSGHHEGGEDSLFQFGHSKDDPGLRQVKVMLASLDPLGLPLATEVVAGNQADDPLYRPAIDQVLKVIEGTGLLFVGDSKMSALETRAHVAELQHHYLCPLALTGKTASDYKRWVADAVAGKQALSPIYSESADGNRRLLAEGYELERTVEHMRDGVSQVWQERVLVIRSERYHQTQSDALKKRLEHATAQLLALTPPPARGKRQFREEAELVAAAQAILEKHQVENLLSCVYEREETTQTKYIGPGRGSSNRPQREIVKVRYKVKTVQRQEQAIDDYRTTLGWRVYATNAPVSQLTAQQAVLVYRDEWLIERGFHRLKGVPLSLDPMFVKRDDQVAGLIHLLSIALRMLTLIEFVVRRQLKNNQEKLAGLIENNPKKGIDNPTTERLLKAFDTITLTVVHLPDRVIRHVTPLTTLQIRILELLGLPPTIYTGLA